ncbi:MAG: chloride channel protein [Oscillospiraceae bacterium]|nr:chloride channel protein [Oscillospiraceae bacterium]
MKEKAIISLSYIKTFLKWIVISVLVGAVGGAVGSLFHKSIDYVTELRQINPGIIWLMPLGGVVIAVLYGISGKRIDTNRVIESVRSEKDIPWFMAPLIFVGTVITHLTGGSAGREGAALQLGGCIGYNMGRMMRLDSGNLHIIVMAGMSAVFTALFGTPLTAIFFALEVTSVGVMYYAGLLPCIISSLCAYFIASLSGNSPVQFSVTFPEITAGILVKTVVLAILCAVICILFCASIQKGEHYAEKYIKNKYLRAMLGGTLLVVLTFALKTYDYNGAGMSVIENAMNGHARYEAFLLKILFTAITISAGFKGGEIVPAFFVGATFGCVVAPVLGLSPGVGAAIGFIALFCGVVNCPVASVLLAFEVFGADSVLIFVLVCGVSYMMSGYCGLYKSQKILYSKLEAKYVNTNAK